jgi:hypothetical protein
MNNTFLNVRVIDRNDEHHQVQVQRWTKHYNQQHFKCSSKVARKHNAHKLTCNYRYFYKVPSEKVAMCKMHVVDSTH